MELTRFRKEMFIAFALACLTMSACIYYTSYKSYGQTNKSESTTYYEEIKRSIQELNKKLGSLSLDVDQNRIEQGKIGIDELKESVQMFLNKQDNILNKEKENKKKFEEDSFEKFDKHIRTHELENLSLDTHDLRLLPAPDPSSMSERWIVVTSIFGPTEDIRKLSSIPGWKLVVVGDKKTPKNWKLQGVVYLSIEDQAKSGFETFQYLKYGVYQRKNIGYLYAIQHGAKYIYDTDDDNHPYKQKITFDEMLEEKEYLVYHDNRTFYNGFAHFGQGTLWPRGYPLDDIDKVPSTSYKKCTNTRPLVQQGVVDGDPDLDAIQRLTRKDSTSKFIVYFDINAPPVVFPPNSFGPYNSQNTFHLYDAFFALLLPQTVTFRVNDIWRSFIAQRLIWDIGGHMAYYPPNAYQDRTPHNFLKDFYEEDDLYRNTNPLAHFLLKWKSETTNIFERHFELVKEIYKIDILGGLDVKLTRAWVRDLIRIGYKPPQMRKPSIKCEDKITTFKPKEMPTMSLRIGQRNVNMVVEGLKEQTVKERIRDDL